MRKATTILGVLAVVLALIAVGCAQPTATPAPTPTNPSSQPGPTTAPPTPTPAAPATLNRYSISAGSATSTYYQFAAPVAEYINKNSNRIRLTPAESGGSTENHRRVERGEMKFGMSLGDDQIKSWKGLAPFTEAMQNSRTIGPDMAPLAFNFIVRTDSGVKTIKDLAGKKFGIGAPGSGAAAMAEQLLKYAGIYDQVEKVALPFDQLGDMVEDRALVGMFRGGVVPLAYINQLSAKFDVTLLDQKEVTETTDLFKDNPAYGPVVIPAGTYKGQTTDLVATALYDWAIAHKDVPDEDVYEFCRLVYSQAMVDALKVAFPQHRLWPMNQKPLDGMALPLHPGAEKFWKEVGVSIPEPKMK